jgi:DNA-binding NarL/FixJ family response regulator
MSTPISYAIKLRASNSKIVFELACDLAYRGFELRQDASYELLIDQPTGYALLETSDKPEKLIVATDNDCPEYLLDLQKRGAVAILPLTPNISLWREVLSVMDGEHVPQVYKSILTPTERFTLYCVARGLDNKQVAKQREVSEGVVKNSLTAIYEKLKLGRDELVHYYLGNSHLLSNWKRGSLPASVLVHDLDWLTRLIAA